MNTTESSSNNPIKDEDAIPDNQNSTVLHESQIKFASLFVELESLHASYQALQSESREKEENSVKILQEKDRTLQKNADLLNSLEEALNERKMLEKELQRVELSSREQEDVLTRKIEEERREMEDILKKLEGLKSVKECLVRVIENLDENKVGNIVDDREETEFDEELKAISKLSNELETKMKAYQEMSKKEKRELENSVVSLTEENRDVNSLLRIALVEKEAVEKSLNRLKGENEQKGVTILKIAERGLQRVGFGFMMGTGANESSSANVDANDGTKSEIGSECEVETVSLASTVERIMKNLRLEITRLRRSLEESRSDTERLQNLTEKQAQELAENTLYIKELEDRETLLTQNVEELLVVLKQTEEEVARWREACELEVEAGKTAIEERDKMVAIFKQELEKTKAALNISNGKLKLKEELAEAAMAAQAASERSLHLADSRASELRQRTEELFRQLEEAEKRGRGQLRRVRHVCWPWRVLKFNPANSTNTTVRNVNRMLPEMQALLH